MSRRGQFLYGFVKPAARLLELAMDGQILRLTEHRDDLLPSFVVPLLERGPHLADGLGGEQQPSARVVEDLASQFQLASRPRDELLSGMRLQLLRVKH